MLHYKWYTVLFCIISRDNSNRTQKSWCNFWFHILFDWMLHYKWYTVLLFCIISRGYLNTCKTHKSWCNSVDFTFCLAECYTVNDTLYYSVLYSVSRENLYRTQKSWCSCWFRHRNLGATVDFTFCFSCRSGMYRIERYWRHFQFLQYLWGSFAEIGFTQCKCLNSRSILLTHMEWMLLVYVIYYSVKRRIFKKKNTVDQQFPRIWMSLPVNVKRKVIVVAYVLWEGSSNSLLCHTYCDTEPHLLRAHIKDRPFSRPQEIYVICNTEERTIKSEFPQIKELDTFLHSLWIKLLVTMNVISAISVSFIELIKCNTKSSNIRYYVANLRVAVMTLVCDYKLNVSLAHMLNNLFHTLC
jgi:hypothetical protein